MIFGKPPFFVILSEAKNLGQRHEILHCAQDDNSGDK